MSFALAIGNNRLLATSHEEHVADQRAIIDAYVREPILGKSRPDHRDGRPLTWTRFLLLRAWARRVAPEHGVSIYLVGSVLSKSRPRDVDVAVVWPHAKFVSLFGPIPPNSLGIPPCEKPTPMHTYLHAIYCRVAADFHSLQDPPFDRRLMRMRVDIHFCPDTWWTDRDRLTLASGAPP